MGLGFKDWVAGEVPSDADFDGYLQRQTVMVFETEAARDAALVGALEEGMMCAIRTNDRVYMYDGSEWVRQQLALSAAGRVAAKFERVANQTIGANATVQASFDTETEDNDGWGSVPTSSLVVPAGLGGLYWINIETATPGDVGENLKINGVITPVNMPMELSAADVITLDVFEGASSATTFTASLNLWRISL